MNILFLCVGNSGRSQIAEALAKDMLPKDFDIRSAGSIPADKVHKDAIQVMKDVGIDISKNSTKSIESLQKNFISNLDYVITLCVEEVCPVVPEATKIIHWPNEYNGSYQYTTKEMNSWVHRDMTNWAGIIYLTPNAPLNSGTGFFKHKQTEIENLDEYNNLDTQLQNQVDYDSSNMDKWELIDYVGNKYNRLVLFQGFRNHRSMEYFGDNINNGRLFQTWFFDTN